MPDNERQSTRPAADALSIAIAAARNEPNSDARWELVEDLVDDAQRPSDVRELFRSVLGSEGLGAKTATQVGQRAVRFYEAWYGDDSTELAQLLSRVLEIDKSAHWAFERLTVALTVAERWDELLAAYDHAIESADETARRMKLLDEAAQVAKDFAASPDRAIAYMSQSFSLDPDNAALAASLERLLERQGRWNDLITLWGSRIDMQPAKQQRDTRLRMASTYLDALQDHASALVEVERVLHDAPEYLPAFELLEKLLSSEATSARDRTAALLHLKAHFQKRQKPKEVVRVLETALSFAPPDERKALLREIVERLLDLHEDARAMRHQASLLVLEPMPNEREALRVLAQRTRDFELHASALSQAAQATSEPSARVDMWMEAAQIREETLGQPDAAIVLYRQVFDGQVGADATVASGRKLVKLLEQTEREQETLDVLSRLSELEPGADARKTILGKVAQIAERLGDTERARKAWSSRVGDDKNDVEALDALVSTAARDKDYAQLAQLLRQRIKTPSAAQKRRSDLVWLAKLSAEELGDLAAGIETWREVRTLFGDDREAVMALTDLLSRAERWQELTDVLKQAAQSETARFTELQTQLGDAYRERLGKPDDAVLRYRAALQVDPTHARARAGQVALLEHEACRALAADSLVESYTHADEWQSTLGLLEVRLATEDSATTRAEMLIEAGELYESRAQDREKALECYTRAFTLMPDDRATEREIRRLAEELGRWDTVVTAYRETIAMFRERTPRMAELRYDEGSTLETRLSDYDGALAAYLEAAEISPTRIELTDAAVRLSVSMGKYDVVAALVVVHGSKSVALSDVLFATIEQGAERADSWDALCEALTRAVLAAGGELRPSIARDLHARIAGFHRSRRDDAQAAVRSLRYAVQADSTHEPSLRALVELERLAPGPELLNTLHALAAMHPSDLDALLSAAEVAIEHVRDPEVTRLALESLYDRALALWRRGERASGAHDAQSALAFAVERLVQLHKEAGRPARALEVLVEASALPFEPEAVQGLRHEAAELAKTVLGDPKRAIELYRDVLAYDSRDTAALAALAELYAQEDRVPELLALRQHELSLAVSAERKLELRLSIVHLLAELEKRGDRVGSLLANLDDAPGHKPSLQALTQLLRAQNRHTELAQVLEAQAQKLGGLGMPEASAYLWRELSVLRERELSDVPGALVAYGKLHALEPLGDASAALARLHTSLGDHAAAAQWLEVRLGTAPPDTRAVTAIELARAHVEAGQSARARGCLEQALAQDPRVHEARDLLAELYRQEDAHEQLAHLLAEGAELLGSDDRKLAYLREAADLYYEKLASPQRAIPVLSRATELAPDDMPLRVRLAEGLHLAERYDEARTVLKGVIDGFGRRRSPERADLHYRLARVAQSAGAVDEACSELEQATKMDLAHQGALHMLASLARDQGDLDRAERAYRGLLLIVRRQRNLEADALGPAEVFFELYRISIARGQHEAAEELLASALESATQSEAEARRLSRVLRGHGDVPLLLRVLDARKAQTREPEALAEIEAERAEVFEQDPKRLGEALETRLRALALDGKSASLHDATLALAKRMDELPRYIDALGTLAEEAGRKRNAEGVRLSAELTLRMGRVIESELHDLDRAAGLYAKVEASGEHVVDAWLAMARVAGARGEPAEQRRVLTRIAELEDEQANKSARDEARFLLAELELSSNEWRDAGVKSLELALAITPDFVRARGCLEKALASAPAHVGVLAVFEHVARQSRDDSMLLDFIERRAALDDAALDDTREGIDLALRIGEMARAEALLRRAAKLARAHGVAQGEATWVFSGLAECRLQAGDVPGALQYLREALELASDAEHDALQRELAQLAAGEGGDLDVAAAAYEALLERDPADRTLWEPLLSVLSQRKDRKRFEAFVERTLSALLPVEDRVVVYLAHASFLIDVLRKEKDATGVLKQLLEEDPTNLAATDRLLAIYQRHGMKDELAELLRLQFDRARDERNVEVITELGLRLGELYVESQPEAACDAYRAALEWDPQHRGLLLALLARLPADADTRERAELSQRLLASATGEAAAALALDVAELWATLDEPERIQEALELGQRACPEHDAVRDRLEALYAERELWRPLSELMVAEAQRLGQNRIAVARLKNAATLYREQLSDTESSAAALRAALGIVPDDISLLAELARNLAAAGQHDTAIADVTRLLDEHPQSDAGRVDLLRVRADLYGSVERFVQAVADLEEAHAISPKEVSASLIDALQALRAQSRRQLELELERSASLRLVEILSARGESDAAREVLAAWVARDPEDAAALRQLWQCDAAAGRLQDVVSTCTRLVEIERGEARVAAVLALAEACETLGDQAGALGALLSVHQDLPDDASIRERLRVLLPALGYKRELAALLLGDALLAQSPEDKAQTYLTAAQLFLEVDDAEAAIEPLGQAMQLTPDDERTRLLLVDIYLRSGRLEEATEIVDQAMAAYKRRRSPELALFQTRMGRICALRGDRDAQLKWLNTALDTDRKSGEVASELVQVAMSVEDYDTAMKALRTLTMMEDPKPITRAIAFLKQAQIAVARGDAHRAQHWARKAKSLDESLTEADDFLAQLGG